MKLKKHANVEKLIMDFHESSIPILLSTNSSSCIKPKFYFFLKPSFSVGHKDLFLVKDVSWYFLSTNEYVLRYFLSTNEYVLKVFNGFDPRVPPIGDKKWLLDKHELLFSKSSFFFFFF